MSFKHYFFLSAIIFLLFASSVKADTFTVTKTADTDDGICGVDCSLREALNAANDNGSGADIINFNIQSSGVQTIMITSQLPSIKTSLTINGASQPGYFGKPLIEISGDNVPGSNGLNIRTPLPAADISVTILALAINGHSYGVSDDVANGYHCHVTLLGNFIGTDPTGTFAKPNRIGVELSPYSDTNIVIGGEGAFEGNLISGNNSQGFQEFGKGISIRYVGVIPHRRTGINLTIKGNKIGTDYSGTAALGNNREGISIVESDAVSSQTVAEINTVIGGNSPQARNIISGNGRSGIEILGKYARIKGNYIGTNANGTARIPNGVGQSAGNDNGIRYSPRSSGAFAQIGGEDPREGNLISGNNGDGIHIIPSLADAGSTFKIQGNLIGTNFDGTQSLGNNRNGIYISDSTSFIIEGIIGGVTPAERNIISGNNADGIDINFGNISVYNNYIGTDKNGTTGLGNGAGVRVGFNGNVKIGGTVVQNSTSYDVGNLISGNYNGIKVENYANFPVTIKRNKIGTNISGTSAIPNRENGIFIENDGAVIGSSTNASDGNIISGNFKNGILLDTAQNTLIYGNRIGTNELGSSAIPNGLNGIEMINSNANQIGLLGVGISTNIISANTRNGILLSGLNSDDNNIENNVIGIGVVGNDLGNGFSGIETSNGDRNSILGNTLAFNQKGVWIKSGVDNPVRRNAIFSNDGLGIDLDTAGVTPNDLFDLDTGANRIQNFPVITTADQNGISATLNSIFNTTYNIDFFRVDSCNASGYGEGRYYLGSKTITTDGNGNASFNFPVSLTLGQFVSATATVAGATGDTSEFSQCKVVDNPAFVSLSSATYSANEGAPMKTIVVSRSGGTFSTVKVNYATSDGTATAGQDYTATNGTLTFNSGEATKSFDIPIIDDNSDEPDETINITLSNPTNATLISPQTAVLTIADNDNAPTISITDVSQNEGNSGTSNFTYYVTLSAASSFQVSANFATADGTANLTDYIGLSGQVVFTPGETDKVLNVAVKGDLDFEPDETFFVNLSNPTNATIADNQGIGTIVNDDATPVSIRGTIRKADNSPHINSLVILSGTQNAQTSTDANGRYVFANLSAGGDYTVSPSDIGYTFTPPFQQFSNLISNANNVDFTANYAPARQVEVVNGVAVSGQNGAINTRLEAQGNENRVAFSLNFDSAILFNPQVSLLPDSQAATLSVDNSVGGKIGINIILPTGQTYPTGTRGLVSISFNTTPTSATSTAIDFDDVPTARETLDGNGNELSTGYASGSIAFVQGFESDVSPRPTGSGNGTVTIADLTQVGRFVAGLDSVSAITNEFQRADSAPIISRGNGAMTVADYTQAGRYAAGLDTVNQVGGPMNPSLVSLDFEGDKIMGKDFEQSNALPRILKVVNVIALPGTQTFVSIEIDSNGDENGFGFSLNYDVTKLSNPLVAKGNDTQSATLFPNTNQSGKVGVVLALPTGQSLTAGTRQIVTIRFDVAANAQGGNTPLTFGDMPVFREVVDANADTLTTTFQDGQITITSPTSASVCVSGRVTTVYGKGVYRAVVSITDSNGTIRRAITSPFGYYRFEEIPVGDTYIINVGHKHYQFNPSSQVLTIIDEVENINFVAQE